MHFEELSLTNIRKYSRASFRFQAGFNLIVGENGAGKTTVLRSLLALAGTQKYSGGGKLGLEISDIQLGSDELEAQAVLIDDNGNKWSLRYGLNTRGKISREGEKSKVILIIFRSNEALHANLGAKKSRTPISREGEKKKFNPESSTPPLSGSEFLYQTERGENLEIRPEERFSRSQEIRPFVVKILSKLSHHFLDIDWRFEAYSCVVKQPAKALFPNEEVQSSSSNVADKEHVIRKDLANLLLRSFQLNPDILGGLDRRNISINGGGFEIGTRDERRVSPPFEQLLRLSMGEDYPKYVRHLQSCVAEVKLAPSIVISTPNGRIALSQCSDGEQRIFSLFVEIVRSLIRSSSRKIDSIPAIVLIDEIDIHLHPKWQRELIPMLEESFPKCQFVATTHSPFVIQSVERQRVQKASDTGGSGFSDDAVSIEDIVEEIQGIEMPQQSKRAKNLDDAAERYFTLLKQDGVDPSFLHEAEMAYRIACEPFASNPALEALLRVETLRAGYP